MGTTARLGLPYPEPTDRVMDGDDVIKSLAQKLDSIATVGSRQSVVKPTDEGVVSSTAFQDDNDFVFSVEAGAKYILEGFLIINGNTTPGNWKGNFVIPAGATIRWQNLGYANDSVPNPEFALPPAGDGTTRPMDTAGGGTDLAVRIAGSVVVTATAGTVKLQWAQHSSHTQSTLVRAGSWMRLERVA